MRFIRWLRAKLSEGPRLVDFLGFGEIDRNAW